MPDTLPILPDTLGWGVRRLQKRLRRYQDALFTFLDHPGVPSGNNHAEREIRPAVITSLFEELRLLKVGARVVTSVRRVVLHSAGGYPIKVLFEQ